jgi:hypothetical protein
VASWRQPTTHAATALFAADGRPAFTAAFLSGRGAADFVGTRVTESFPAELPWARAAGSAVELPPDRPLTPPPRDRRTPWRPITGRERSRPLDGREQLRHAD